MIGENGAGKSTLMKILSGVYQADAGVMLVDGKEVHYHEPRQALHDGICMIYQELNLVQHLSVGDNIFIGRESQKGWKLDRTKDNRRAEELLKELELDVSPNTTVSSLTVAKQQMIEIAKGISYDSKVLIMDEPTAALSINEIKDLFRVIQKLKAKGISIIYISHRLEELFEITDRITVMRDGAFINASADSSQVDEQINILNQALAKQPNAILIAACDSGALDEQMITARDAGIPVIAYNITFDNAPEGSLTATSASDSILAAGQAADELLKNETVVEKIKAATPENPAVFSVIAPDAIMTVHRDRTSGFANRMYELCQEWQPGAVAITGNDAFAKDSEKDPAVIIRTDIAASRADEDIRNLAQSVVSDSSVLAIFCVNEASATGILSATSDGLDLDRTNGKYKDLIVIGFDSGSTLNNAVRSGYFYGAVAQDPYTMGYEAMMMAINVLQGGEASDIVIPAVWFDASNMDDPEISRILYD